MVLGYSDVVVADVLVHRPTFTVESDPPRECMVALLSTALIVCLLTVIWRHGRRWHLGKDPVQRALVLASGMSIGAML